MRKIHTSRIAGALQPPLKMLRFVALQSQPREPLVHFGLRLASLVLRDRSAQDERLFYGGGLVQALDVAVRAACAASFVRAERDERLSAQIVRLKERVDHHRKVAPPNRVADEHGVVLRRVDVALVGGARLGVQLLFRKVGAGAVFLGIGVLRHNLERVRVRLCRNHLGDNGGVALGDVPHAVLLARVRKIDDERLRAHVSCQQRERPCHKQ